MPSEMFSDDSNILTQCYISDSINYVAAWVVTWVIPGIPCNSYQCSINYVVAWVVTWAIPEIPCNLSM